MVLQIRVVMCRLLVIEFFCISDIEVEEVSEFSSCIDFSLLCVFVLFEYGCSYNVVVVFVSDKVGSFEEDGGLVGEGQRFL